MQDLARLVPTLASARCLSKVLIVKESVQHLQRQRSMCIAAANDVQDLLAENQRLVSEVNTLRQGTYGSIIASETPKPVTKPMMTLMSVKDEVFGNFSVGFGDSWLCKTTSADENAGSQGNSECLNVSDSDGYTTQEPSYLTQSIVQMDEAMVSNMLPYATTGSGPQPYDEWSSTSCLSDQDKAPFASLITSLESTNIPCLDSCMPVDGIRYMSGPSEVIPSNAITHHWFQSSELVYDDVPGIHYDYINRRAV